MKKIICAFVNILVVLGTTGCTSSTAHTYSDSETSKIVSSTSIIESSTAGESSEPNDKSTELNGRGIADNGREEPNYIGVRGYAVVSSSKEYELSMTDKFGDESLWTVPTYTKDKQFWNEIDYVLPHKTEVVVIKQFLSHEGFGAYSGYLLVKEISSGNQVYINVSNYITKPYWTYTDDLLSAAKIGCFVAELNQKSNYYPVNSSGEKVILDNGTLVLVNGITGMMRGVDRNENGIKAIVWKEWKYGYGGVDVYFNKSDLSIIY